MSLDDRLHALLAAERRPSTAGCLLQVL